MRRALLALLLLAACAGPADRQGYRDPRATIASAALFDPARFAGDWFVLADFPAGTAACGVTRESWRSVGPGRFTVTGTACGPRGAIRFDGRATVTGPGRIDLAAPARAELEGAPVWVLWVDADYRVAVLGTPSGRFGTILGRSPERRGDLFAAAREVLDFNGYTTDRLRLR
ncbi:lipocalin family protein [Frigidibacter oleivorans]|uniref:lipocalin family protein n=1 Tax=Frigidibacter oleivorans TaxID=2487129 RepID=UPI0013DF0EC4|nr:lipocalin family protein [Frigidibacter oleivorans]